MKQRKGEKGEPDAQMRNCVSRESPEIQGQNRNRSQYLEKFNVQYRQHLKPVGERNSSINGVGKNHEVG